MKEFQNLSESILKEGNEEGDRRLRKLIDVAGIGIVILNQDHAVIDANQRFADMLGYTLEELFQLHIWDWEANMPEEEIRKEFENLEGLHIIFETRHRRKDGSLYDVEISAYGASFGGATGDYNASICICQDISHRKEMERPLRISEAKYKNLVENASEIILSLDEENRIEYISPNCKRLAGYEPEEVQGRQISEFFLVEENRSLDKIFSETGEAGGEDLMVRHRDGTHHWYNVTCTLSKDIDGTPIKICHGRNIDERKDYEEKLHYMSTHDQLTDAYNRRFFDSFLAEEVIKKEFPFSLLVCDIDGLKAINDTYGHGVGDQIIQESAIAIQSSLKSEDLLARTGGDEFVVILPSAGEEEAKAIVYKIQQAVDGINESTTSLPVKLSVTIGTATAWDHGISIDQLLTKADQKMYEKKDKGCEKDPEKNTEEGKV